MIPLHIGNYPVHILSQDMRNDECVGAHGQHQVRLGLKALGYWEVFVEEDGEYEFVMRRWPESHPRELSAGIDGDDIDFFRGGISEKDWFRYTGGVALPITKAKISIQDRCETVEFSGADLSVTFRLRLIKGECILNASFGNDEVPELLSPYFIYVKKVD
jgi:hypothetical protein